MIALLPPQTAPIVQPREAGRAREQIQPSLSFIQVKTYIPKVPKQSLVPHHLNTITDNPPSSLRPEPEHSTEDTSHEALYSNEGPEGPSITHRAFVPMPPICSDSTVHSETLSHQSHTAGLMGSENLSDDDAKSTESIFLTQVTAPSCLYPQLQHPQVPTLLWTAQGSQETPKEVQLTGTVMRGYSGHYVLWHRQHLGSHWDLVLASLWRLVTTCPSLLKGTSLLMLPWVLGTKMAQTQVPLLRKAGRSRACHQCWDGRTQGQEPEEGCLLLPGVDGRLE